MAILRDHPLFRDMCAYLLAASARISEKTFTGSFLMPGKCVTLPTGAVKGRPAKTLGGAVFSVPVAADRKSAATSARIRFPAKVTDAIIEADGRRRMFAWKNFAKQVGIVAPRFDPFGDFPVEYPRYLRLEAGLGRDRKKEFGEYLDGMGWKPWFVLKVGFRLLLSGKFEIFADVSFDFSSPYIPRSGSLEARMDFVLHRAGMDVPSEIRDFKRGINAMVLAVFPGVDWKAR